MIINGVSKGYAMTGWRIGYSATPLWLAKACCKLQGQMTSGANSIAQKAAVAALSSDGEYPKMMCQSFQKRRDLVVEKLKKIPGFDINVPQGAFYVFPEISKLIGKSFNGEAIKNSSDLAMFLLNTAHVAMVPGSAFGAENYIRLSYAASESELVESLNRVAKAVEQLK